MKSILISIKSEYVAKILNGEKTIEIRKTAPKCELPIDVYIYCTKEKPYLAYEKHVQEYILCDTIEELGEPGNVASPTDNACALQDWGVATNGHIVAKFTLRKFETIFWHKDYISPYINDEYSLSTDSLSNYQLRQQACLKNDELDDYIGCNLDNLGYAWHISDLVIFDEPKKLSDFGLNRAPQSWCYVEELKNDRNG